jgi:hypothetical protein
MSTNLLSYNSKKVIVDILIETMKLGRVNPTIMQRLVFMGTGNQLRYSTRVLKVCNVHNNLCFCALFNLFLFRGDILFVTAVTVYVNEVVL